jgi:Replication protein/Transposase zinc-binding domain
MIFKMREVLTPKRPNRLDARAREPHAMPTFSGGGSVREAVSDPKGGAEGKNRASKTAPAQGKSGPCSLDTGNHLETSNRVCEEREKKGIEIWNAHLEHKKSHDRVTATFHEIWQSYGGTLPGEDPALEIWRENYEIELKTLPEETGAERWKRVEGWKKANPPWGRTAKSLEWERAYLKIEACQKEWVIYRAACCEGATQPVAVPVGCNHRLCAFCNWRRSQKAYRQLEAMLPHLEHPELITLTIPNLAQLSKREINGFRRKQSKLLKSWGDKPGRRGLIRGGLYAMESTRNYFIHTWHLHSHILCDFTSALPPKEQKILFAGKLTFAFNVMKWRLEFDWLRLWVKTWGKEPGRNASKKRIEEDRALFEEWARLAEANKTKEFDYRRRVNVDLDLTREEMERRTAWNRDNRRVVEFTPVTDRNGALKEVVKYITKGHDFIDDPEATEEFCNATKSARMVQTFGNWYGVDLGLDDVNKEPETWEALGSCACGDCKWERAGVVSGAKITMGRDGRWLLKAPYDHKETGIVRPTARGLAGRRGREPSYVVTDEHREQDYQQFKREWGTPGRE